MAQKQPSGFDYKFVDPIEEYICSICQSVLRSPVQTKCGHQFCKDCLMFAHKKSGKQECPIDREQLTKQQIFSDKATERKILSFKVHCPNQGCTWQGELRNIQSKPVKPGQAVSQNHLDTCPMRVIPCSYKPFGCDFKGPLKSHSEHVITYHLAFTMENMFSLQEENKKLKQQMETMTKDLEAKTNSVKENMFSFQKENKKLNRQMETMTKDFEAKTNSVKENMFSFQKENKKLNLQLETMTKDFEAKTNSVKDQTYNLKKQFLAIQQEFSSLKHQVHGISEQTDDDIRKIQDQTTRLVSRIVLLDNQLEENSKNINKNMATNISMFYNLDQECIRLHTDCERRDQNGLWKIETETLTCTLQTVQYYLIILVMVVLVVTVMVGRVLFVQKSQLNQDVLKVHEVDIKIIFSLGKYVLMTLLAVLIYILGSWFLRALLAVVIAVIACNFGYTNYDTSHRHSHHHFERICFIPGIPEDHRMPQPRASSPNFSFKMKTAYNSQLTCYKKRFTDATSK